MNDDSVSLAVSPATGHLFAAFEAVDLGGTDRDIHVARSTDGGATWQVWEMPAAPVDEYDPDIAVDAAGYLHVAWIRDDGYIARARSSSPEDPSDWAWVKGLFTDTTNAVPSIAVSGAGDFATVYIVADMLEYNTSFYSWEWTLVWMWSTDGGLTVGWDMLVPDGYPDLWPEAALVGGLCHLVNAEQDPYTGAVDILLASDGISGGFADVTNLSTWTADFCGYPRVAAAGDNVYVAYQRNFDDGMGTVDGDIIYALSQDAGASVFGPYALVEDTNDSVGPALYARDGVVGALWLEAPPLGDEYRLAARQAGAFGHPDAWGPVEIVNPSYTVEPRFHAVAGALGQGKLHAAWIDRRDYPTQGLNVYASERAALPDLAPFTPDGWSGPLVVGATPGDRGESGLRANAPAYLSFAFQNLGLTDIGPDFLLRLYVDGTAAGSWALTGGLPVSTFVPVEDHELLLGAGAHHLEVRLDIAGAVAEMAEDNNVLAADLNWIDGAPRLVLSTAVLRHAAPAPAPAASAAMLAADPPVRTRSWLPAAALPAAKAAAGTTLRLVVTPAEQLDAPALARGLAGAGTGLRRATARAAQQTVMDRNRARLAPIFAELAARGLADAPRELWLPGVFTLNATPEAAALLAEHPDVGRVWVDDRPSRALGGPAGVASTTEAPDAASVEWHLTRIGAEDAWAQGLDGDGVLVGHLDTGVSYDHPDLAGGMWDGGAEFPNHGWDFVDEDDDPYDEDATWNHGTHTAGCLVGDGSGGHVTGAAPGARVMALRAVPGYFSDLVEALQFGLDHGAHLFSMSAGWEDPLDDLKEANRANAEILLAAGVPWICAAGNGDGYGGHYDAPQDIVTPGDCPDPWFGEGGHSAVIAVGASTPADAIWIGSSRGPTVWNIAGAGYDDYPFPPGLTKPDLAAPGDQVLSTVGNDAYAAYSGTSMATPLAAAAAAILMQAAPGLAPAQLAQALESTAVDIAAPGRDDEAGAGLIDIPAALAALPASGSFIFHARNAGPLPLHLTGVAVDAAWLSVTPTAAVVAPGDSVRMVAWFDPAGLAEGLHYATVTLASDDPESPHALPAVLAVGDVTGVGGGDAPPAPAAGRLGGHPNPFNPRTTLRFALDAPARVELAVFDLRGRKVRTLVEDALPAGSHEAAWDGADGDGRPLPSGVYLAQLLRDGAQPLRRKLTLVR